MVYSLFDPPPCPEMNPSCLELGVRKNMFPVYVAFETYRRLYQIFRLLARLILAIPAHYVHYISRDLCVCVWTGFRWRNTLDMCLHRVWRIISMWALFFRKQWVNQIPFECGTTLHNLRCWRCRCYMPKFSRWNWDYMLYIYMTS